QLGSKVVDVVKNLTAGSQVAADFSAAWTDAITPITDGVTGAVDAMAEWAMSTSLVQGAFTTLKENGADLVNNIRIAIMRGTEVWNNFKDAAVGAFESVSAKVTSFGGVFGAVLSPIASQVSGVADSIRGYLGNAIEFVGLTLRNWPEFFNLAFVEIKE